MALFGQETEKAIHNFGRGTLHRDFIRAYGEVKLAALSAAQKTKRVFSSDIAVALKQAVQQLIDGEFDADIVVPFRQGGAGTSTNMNINEVIAAAAGSILIQKGSGEKVEAIRDVNIYQSTNDTYGTALTVMAYRHLTAVEEKVVRLQERLITLENELGTVVAAGRTEMQSALPVTMGQIFGSFAGATERDRWRLNKLKERIRSIPLGGTAVGTCFNAPQQYIFEAERALRQVTGLPLCRSQNLPDEISNADKYAELASGYRLVALNLFKISGDLLFYSSSAVGEIKHPDLQYGSTIMAAKSNPVALELIRGLAIEVQGEACKIDLFAANGQLQLNAYLPFIAESLLVMYHDLVRAIDTFVDLFLAGMQLQPKRIEDNLVDSNVLLNALLPFTGYAGVKKLYQEAANREFANVDALKVFIMEHTTLTAEDLDDIFDPFKLTTAMKG